MSLEQLEQWDTIIRTFNNNAHPETVTMVDIMVDNLVSKLFSGEILPEGIIESIYGEDLFQTTVDDIATEDLDNFKQQTNDIALNLKIVKYPNFNKQDKDKECSICFLEYTEKSLVVNLPCNHLFHEVCIRNWGKVKPECPVCRSKIKLLEPLFEEMAKEINEKYDRYFS